MKGFIFFLVLSLSFFSEAQLECDNEIFGTVEEIFSKKEKSVVHSCLHIQDMEKVVTVVERHQDLGALSLFVFSEGNMTKNSKPLSSIHSFAIDGLKELSSNNMGLDIKKGVGYFYREAFKEGVIVLQYKNETDFNDVSLVRLRADGKLSNFNLHSLDSGSITISQTENMDLFVFKVAPMATIDIVPWSNKVVIDNRFDPEQKLEIYLGGDRAPASISQPKK